ncbi:MAG: Imm7 family immunity protein [Planctomycetota bacterium]
MLYAYGWCVIRSSRSVYVGATLDEKIEQIDDRVDAADKLIIAELESWLTELGDVYDFQWSLKAQAWSEAKVLLYTASRNHRPSHLWDFHDWVIQNAPGSYGLTYVHDDEDVGETDTNTYRSRTTDYSNMFRVFRIANGRINELDDPFLSPIVPTIDPSELA